jgi:hypothetical protein
MKSFYLALIALIMVSLQLSCNGQTDQKQTGNESEIAAQVGVYYFHFERRCTTCINVEENSKKAVEELYPEQVKSGEYFFQSVNLDEKSGKETGDKMGIGMQTLVVVHGEKKVDITGEGFMYADNYNRLKSEVQKAVDKALK